MSGRYRSYGALDDQPQEAGDSNFVGVNQFDSAENLQPGQVRAATNIDFTTGDAATRGGFVCIPELAAAPFGSAWTGRTSSIDNSWTSIAYGNGMFVAVASSGTGTRVMSSPDGIIWTTRTSASDIAWTGVCFGNGKFVAVASTVVSTGVMYSTDGISWTTVTQSFGSSGWNAVAYGDGRYVAVGPSAMMTSTNATSWTVSGDGVNWNNFSSITYGNGKFVIVSFVADLVAARVFYTTNGTTITAGTGTVALSWRGVAYGNGVFVAVASDGIGNRVLSSSDGIAWTSRTSAADNDWRGVTFGNGMFVAVAETGTGNRVMVSTDGITWKTLASAADNDWQAVAYGGGVFAAVSDTGTGTRVMTMGGASVLGFGTYSDPNATSDLWTVLVGATSAGFYAFGKSSHTISYPAGVTITKQSTAVQANNKLFIFPGTGQTPLVWDGNWSNAFTTVAASTLGVGFESIPQSNHAIYAQNRLWVVNGKDQVAASDVLDFEEFDQIANAFNLNAGSADYVVCTYPFGDNSIVVFKHNSSVLLENVQGDLNKVTATGISRNLGISGINAVTAVGPDLIYVSDRNITTTRLNIQNKLQNITEPLSRDIGPILRRVNWTYGYKISMGYWNNLLYVAIPLDNATTCSTVVVYNFITQKWYGEWNFAAAMNMAIIGWVTSNYLGQIRLHAVTEDGRVFVTDNGQQDIAGATVCEISTSLTTRAYSIGTGLHAPRRMFMDLSTNRPNFSVTAYSDGANESTTELTAQTYSRADSWIWNDSAYDLTNANNDFNRAFRKDYSTGPDSIQCGASGILPEMTQDYRLPLITRRHGRLSWFNVANTTGFLRLNTLGIEASESNRSNLTQVG